MVRLQTAPIDVGALVREVAAPGAGAVATFLGTVRDHNAGRRVLYLEYHAWPEMALRELAELERAAVARFAVTAVTLVHRTGRLSIGEASVAVVVSAPHRADAFEACRFLIDTLKKTVPIWKKEFFEGGEVWIEGQP